MFERVNLLPRTQIKVRQTNHLVGQLKIAAQVLAILFVLVILAEFSWVTYTRVRIESTLERINAVRADIEQQADTEGRYLYFQQVLINATNIIDSRKNFLESLDALYSRLGPNVSIEGISFTDTSLLFSGRADNVQIFAQTLEGFRQLSRESPLFGDMVLQTSTREADGRYAFRIEMELLTAADVDGNQE